MVGEGRIRIVVDGRSYVGYPCDEARVPAQPGEDTLSLNGRWFRLAKVDSFPCVLSPRELEVVALVAKGRTNKEIAARLRISEWTVSAHLRRIFAKLGVDCRAAAVYRCFSWLESPAWK